MMEQKEYWKTNLTPYDSELALMVESLTEMPCELKNGGDHYFFEADYSKHNDAQWILAVWDAIEGRTGERLISMEDQPERNRLFVRVKFSSEKYPQSFYAERFERCNPECGNVYCHTLEEIRAIQVKPQNFEQLVDFVGNGELEKPKDEPAIFHFRNASGSVFEHAKENDYIKYVSDGLFVVVEKEKFETEYEPK